MVRKLLLAGVSACLAVLSPADAYTLSGTLNGNDGGFYLPLLPFDRDGTVTLVVTLVSATPFLVADNSGLDRLDLYSYQTFDPQTGAVTGGDADFGPQQRVLSFSGDELTYTVFRTDLTQQVSRRHDYALKANGDPFPSEIGYFETLLWIGSGASEGASPVAYSVIVDGTAVVPEPAGWALMTLGFGMAGAAVRRRRATAISS